MMYIWISRKPHRRHVIEHGVVKTVFIEPGQQFEPTPAELLSFGDRMEPVGQSLRAEGADDPPVPPVAP
jgi:hypothetical protein